MTGLPAVGVKIMRSFLILIKPAARSCDVSQVSGKEATSGADSTVTFPSVVTVIFGNGAVTLDHPLKSRHPQWNPHPMIRHQDHASDVTNRLWPMRYRCLKRYPRQHASSRLAPSIS